MIQIIKQPSATLNNAYNNSILEFDSDSPQIPKEATLVFTSGVDSFTVKIAPNTGGVFRYNLKEISKAFVNGNNFGDSQSYSEIGLLTDMVKDGTPHTLKTINVDITIDFLDESQENNNYDFTYLRSVEQVDDRVFGEVVGTNNIYLLSPFDDNSTLTYFVTYFEGLPFDLSIYLKNASANLNVLHENSGIDYDFTCPSKKVVRLFFSDGSDDVSINDAVPLADGYNRLLLTASGSGSVSQNQISIDVLKMDANCGFYLKWLNNYGGWSYHLFDASTFRERKIKSVGEVFNDFGNLSETFEPSLSMGSNATDTMTLTSTVTNRQNKILATLSESPAVFLYTGSPYAAQEEGNWIRVMNDTKKFTVQNYRDAMYNVEVDIELPSRNTMKLL